MTEPQEAQEPAEPEAPAEPEEAQEPAPEAPEQSDNGADDADEDEEGEGAPPPEQPEGLSEKEIEARFEKLDKEKQRHAKRVGEILEEEALALVPCELCWPPAPGFRFPQMPEEQRSAVLSAIGFEPEPELEDDKTARQCPDCKGFGKVKTGSKVSGYGAMVCGTCKGAGAVGERFAAVTPAQPTLTPQSQSNGETVATDDMSDEAIMMAALRAKGFTVMAPPVVTTT